MRVVQVVMSGATEYERKCQRVDFEALTAKHQVVVMSIEEAKTSGADVAHVYAGGELPAAPFLRFPMPYVASADVKRSRWPWRRATEPGYVVSPLQELPEAVEERYWNPKDRRPRLSDAAVIGSFARPSIANMIAQTLARIHRFREDVAWTIFDAAPEPQDFENMDLWVDPATEENDFDGFVAEAVVAGLPVVAARNRINAMRLEQGRTGALVPPRDPNEMTHAILSALFKPEVARNQQNAARQTVSKFRARQRIRVLQHMYETLIS